MNYDVVFTRYWSLNFHVGRLKRSRGHFRRAIFTVRCAKREEIALLRRIRLKDLSMHVVGFRNVRRTPRTSFVSSHTLAALSLLLSPGMLVKEVTEDDAIPQEQKENRLNQLFDTLISRFLDTSTYVRARLLATLTKLCEYVPF